MLKFTSDYLDEACKKRTGHDHWLFLTDKEILRSIEGEIGLEIAEVVVMLKEPDPLIEKEVDLRLDI